MWSQKYKHCIQCGSIERKYVARGFCELCYQKKIERQHSPEKVKKGFSSSVLTKEYLTEHYLSNQESLSDIASNARCSRQFVF